MKRLRITSPAQIDYLEAIGYYEEREPGLGSAFEAELHTLLERIKRNLEHFPYATRTVHRARMPRFKYGIFFTVEVDEIGVLAIYHPSRNPETLFRRFK